jgi:hypothetical protein
LLDDLHPTWINLIDVVLGGLTMHLTRSSLFAPAALFATIGLGIAGTIAFMTPVQYASTATMHVRSAGMSFPDARLPGLIKAQLSGTDVTPHRILVRRIGGSNNVFQISVIDSAPVRSQEMTQLLAQKLATAKYEAGLGVEVVDPATLDDLPISPSRIGIAGTGFAVGAIGSILFGLFRSRRSLVRA